MKMMRFLGLLAAALAQTCAAAGSPTFQSAKPVWPEGRELQMNSFVEFRASFDAKDGERPVLRVTGSSVYRIRLNGEFAGYGPARAAKGFFRVDEWPLAAKAGRNEIVVEAAAYNCNNYYIPEWPGFLQAEVVADGRVMVATGVKGAFKAFETPRMVRCSRFSFQRAFNEAYSLDEGWKGAELPLAERPAQKLLERIAPLPDFPVTAFGAPISATKVVKSSAKYRPVRFVDDTPGEFKCFPADTLQCNVWRELQSVDVVPGQPVVSDGDAAQIAAGSGLVYNAGFNETGFPGMTVECRKAGRLWMAFDEILVDGKVNALRCTVGNGVAWDMKPGKYRIEAFEPYTFQYMHVYATEGEFKVSAPFVRGIKNPDAKRAAFKSSDPAIDKIFAAARETFAQNAVDVFTDCPSRERAGWLCDSFFTARSSLLFTGSAELERLFFQNYLLPEKFPDIPDGALPMCYPSDHPNHVFIPNWTMWFVLELDEYLARSGDRATVDALKPRLVKLIDYLKTFRNPDGLLEKLPSWVFVEWSEANKLVKDVNYPSNMTWAEVLDAMDRLYGMPELAEEAKKVRETVRRQSWTGRWFCDNAVRQADGSLKLSGKCTETCQYYAFMFGTATPQLYPDLWCTLLEDFGPKRHETKKHPEIFFSNAFIGNYLRLELLSRARLDRQLLDETKGYFSFMAERTGTLWEHDGPRASCNHGFASHAAVFYAKCVLGVQRIDARAKIVEVRPTDVPLKSCEATFPVSDGAVTYGWTDKGGKRSDSFKAPSGWRLVRVPAKVARKGVYAAYGRFSGKDPADRASVDVKFRNDLSRARGVAFDLTASNMSEFSGFMCYFRSGKGWYSSRFVPGNEGETKRVFVDKANVGVEGSPSGWRDVDTVRVSGWRGGTNDAAFTVANMVAVTNVSDVLVVQAQSCIARNPSERKSCTEFAARLAAALRVVGLDCDVVSDLDFDDKTLDGVKAVMLPYNPNLPADVIDALVKFSERGGKIFAAYGCPQRIFGLLGLANGGFMKSTGPGGRFGGLVRNGKGLAGQPEFAPQGSWATMKVKPLPGAEVVAWWGDPGSPTDLPALVRNPRGVYMGHVWMGSLKDESRALIKAIILDMLPEKRSAMEAAYAAAVKKAREDAAWAESVPSTTNAEFRAFWCHSPLGLGGGKTWDESIAILKKSGFNTILANLAWGGSADYPSEVLPRTTPELDTFAACKAACEKYGVRFHVWKVCYNLGGTRPPAEFIAKLKAEGRLQVSYGGKEEKWLCPSHPANQKLEIDAFVELAKKGPHGIHFDYIRYPGSDNCFCAGCRERFEKKYGAVSNWPADVRRDTARVAQWNEFRRDAITAVVRGVARRVRAEAPGVEISAAVFDNYATCRNGVGQDWALWCREGLLDFVCPMDYTNATSIFAGIVARQKALLGDFPLYPGIGLSSSGADAGGRLRRVVEQIMECRKAGCKGFTVFNFDAAAEEVLPVLSRGPTR